MGFLDDAKAKAEELIKGNPDKVESISDAGIEKAGDAVDGLTGGKFADKVDAAQQKADEAIGE